MKEIIIHINKIKNENDICVKHTMLKKWKRKKNVRAKVMGKKKKKLNVWAFYKVFFFPVYDS